MKFAKVAVAGINYCLDRPYDYAVPDHLADAIRPGQRVFVPFTRHNRKTEGVVLSVCSESSYEECKELISIIDNEPVLSADFIRMALWMREKYFCTVYDCISVMIPAGERLSRSGKKTVQEKQVKFITLSASAEKAQELIDRSGRKAPMQAAVLRTLLSAGDVTASELTTVTGASSSTIAALERSGMIATYFSKPPENKRISQKNATGIVPDLNENQKLAFDGLNEKIKSGKYSAALLHGVTGSGKTAVYLNLIQETVLSGKTCLIMVPEISLTPQMVETFSHSFPDNVAVLHSALGIRQRLKEWNRIRNKEVRIVVGTRSAVFAPIEHVGLIIVDEEQEDTYKSENSPRYNAIEIADYICQKENALLLLGSATPSVERMYLAKNGFYSLYTLKERFNGMALPQVKIADMKQEISAGNFNMISRLLKSEIQNNLDKGEQTLLLINRRGTSKIVTCGSCGFVYKCPNCSTTLFYHGDVGKLICHYCGHTEKMARSCPDCGGKLLQLGEGIQKAEDELHDLFPGTDILRIDSDVVSGKNDHDFLFSKFRNERIPIMLGTQMIAKGLNFENVTLTGILSADMSLYSGGYRSSERTFSLITQAIGRSGRFSESGRAVIQTYSPQNFVIQTAAEQNYERFYELELPARALENAPPYVQLFVISFIGKEEDKVYSCAEFSGRILKKELSSAKRAQILGPAPYPIVKVQNEYRYKLTVSAGDENTARKVISKFLYFASKDEIFRGISVYADMNPFM